MLLIYFTLLIISIALYFLIGCFTNHIAIKVAVPLFFLIVTSTYTTQLIIKGHKPPEGSKMIDMDEMAKKWDEHKAQENKKK